MAGVVATGGVVARSTHLRKFFSAFSYVCGTNNAVKTLPQLAPALPFQGQPETDAEVQFAAVLLLLLLLLFAAIGAAAFST